MGKETLAVVEPPPPDALALYGRSSIQLMASPDGALGLAVMDVFSLQLWAREAGGADGVASCFSRALTSTCSLQCHCHAQVGG